MALDKSGKDARGIAPPDGIAEIERRAAVERDLIRDLRTGGGVVLLDGRARRVIAVVQILGRVGLGRNDLEEPRAGECGDPFRDGACGAGAAIRSATERVVPVAEK